MGLTDLLDEVGHGLGNFGNTVGNFFSDIGLRGSQPSTEAQLQQMLGQQDSATGADPFSLQAIMAVLMGINPGGEMGSMRPYDPAIVEQAQRLGIDLPDPNSPGEFSRWGGDTYLPDSPVAVGGPGEIPMTGTVGDMPPQAMEPEFPASFGDKNMNLRGPGEIEAFKNAIAPYLSDTYGEVTPSQPATLSDLQAAAAESMMRRQMETRQLMQPEERGSTSSPFADYLSTSPVRRAQILMQDYHPPGETMEGTLKPTPRGDPRMQEMLSLIKERGGIYGTPRAAQAHGGLGPMPADAAYPSQRPYEMYGPETFGMLDNAVSQGGLRPGGQTSPYSSDTFDPISKTYQYLLDQVYGGGEHVRPETVPMMDNVVPEARMPQDPIIRSSATTLDRLVSEMSREGIPPQGEGRFVPRYTPRDALQEFMKNKLGYQQGL
jgi:hypothetical protein